jgi:signal peptidase I
VLSVFYLCPVVTTSTRLQRNAGKRWELKLNYKKIEFVTPGMRRFWSSIWEVAEVVLIAVITVFLIRNFLAQPFLVSGASMEPNFSHGNYLLIDEITYRFREPQRGDVIVFRSPEDPKTFFIKRVIGLPGEQVSISEGDIRIFTGSGDEVTFEESYIFQGNTPGSIHAKLSPNEYIVLGDNRNNSFDSRNWGPLDEESIIGIVRLRLFPFNDLEVIKTPAF